MLFDYQDGIGRVVITINAIESLISAIRKAIKNRRFFPNDVFVMKAAYLAIEAASKKRTIPFISGMLYGFEL